MRTSFLDYYKLILGKVSFRQELFVKEYRKAMKRLADSDQEELNRWLQDQGSFAELMRCEVSQMNTTPESFTNFNK